HGPKIDIDVLDALGRRWQLATIQIDFAQPDRFALEYIDTDGQPKRPVMVHRAIFGTFERFIGVLTEHYAGVFPTWLAPVQARVLPVSEKHAAYGRTVWEKLRAARVRAELDDRNEKLGYRIREAQIRKVPYMLVVGERESQNGTVSLRHRSGEDLGVMPIQQALETARQQELDLVEVAPEAQPPVCRIMDFGKYKYTQARRLKEARKKQTTILVKEVKMGPKTEKHDFDFKLRHVRRFLEEGHKAKVTVRFKGREMAHTELGWKMLNKMVEATQDIAITDNNPRMEGRMLHIILSPKSHN